MLTKAELKERGRMLAKHKWGDRLIMSIFPLSKKGHRVSVIFKGKEVMFAGEDRADILEQAFDWIRTKI